MNLRYQNMIDKHFFSKFYFTVIYSIISSIFVIILVISFKRLPLHSFIRNMYLLYVATNSIEVKSGTKTARSYRQHQRGILSVLISRFPIIARRTLIQLVVNFHENFARHASLSMLDAKKPKFPK